MGSYHFKNHRGKTLVLVFWGSDTDYNAFTKMWDVPFSRNQSHDFVGFGRMDSPRRKDSVPDDTSVDWDSGTPSLVLAVQGDVVVGPFHVFNGRHYILKGLDNPLLNVEDALNSMETRLGLPLTPKSQAIRPPGAVGSDPGLVAARITLSVASALLSGLATGLSAAGSKFAIKAGAVASTDGLLNAICGMAMDGFNPPPQPPNVNELTNAVVSQVRVALREDRALGDAERATNVVDNTVGWFTSRIYNFTRIDGSESPSGKPGKKYKFVTDTTNEFQRELANAMSVVDQDTFASQLKYVASRPEIGKFMLPSLVSGIGMWATLRRIQIGLAYGRRPSNGNVPDWELNEFISDLRALRSGLLAAMKAYSVYRSKVLTEVGMEGIREAIVLIKRMGEAYLGDPLAIPHPMYKKYTSDADYWTEEGSGWNYDLARGSDWLPESGYVGRDSKGHVQRVAPTLDRYGEALTNLDSVLASLSVDSENAASGKWADHLLPITVSP